MAVSSKVQQLVEATRARKAKGEVEAEAETDTLGDILASLPELDDEKPEVTVTEAEDDDKVLDAPSPFTTMISDEPIAPVEAEARAAKAEVETPATPVVDKLGETPAAAPVVERETRISGRLAAEMERGRQAVARAAEARAAVAHLK